MLWVPERVASPTLQNGVLSDLTTYPTPCRFGGRFGVAGALRSEGYSVDFTVSALQSVGDGRK